MRMVSKPDRFRNMDTSQKTARNAAPPNSSGRNLDRSVFVKYPISAISPKYTAVRPEYP